MNDHNGAERYADDSEDDDASLASQSFVESFVMTEPLQRATVSDPVYVKKGLTGGHFQYPITFIFSNEERYAMKRFSDFEQIHRVLSGRYPAIKQMPGFPKKSSMTTSKATENRQRAEKFDIFVKIVAVSCPFPKKKIPI